MIAEPPLGYRVEDLPLAQIRALGARVDGTSHSRVRIAGSPAVLARVAALPGIGELRFPLVPIPVEGSGTIISEAVALVGASSMQTNGVTGSGVDVAVLDLGFWRLTEAKGTGDIPANEVSIDCVTPVSGCVNDPNSIQTVTSHGTGVAEQIADVAPGVRLHLVQFADDVDFENAVDYVNTHGIRIANLSVNWFGASYYDDTGTISTLINTSYDTHGVFWAVGAGNWGYRHWRGSWLDADGDRYLEFAAGDEQLDLLPESTANSCLTLNWNQYTGATTDLDLKLYSNPGAVLVTQSTNMQSSSPPVEQVCFNPDTTLSYYLRVYRKASTPAAPGLNLTIVSSNVTITDHPIAASSMVDPAVAHGAFAVGAVNYTQWNQASPVIESLSSQGPTNDGRPKPEIVAPDGTQSLTKAGVLGTSFASPVVAGAAALILAQNSTLSNLQIRAALVAAAHDVGAAGQDPVFGWGKLVVPQVPLGPDADADGIQDAWDDCPFTPNSSQLDANTDGIGDACQCGDLSGDGLISSVDADLMRDWILGATPPPAGLSRCNVIGAAAPAGSDCRIDDWVVLKRDLGAALPGPAQVCGPALPP